MAFITSTSFYLPENIVDNKDLVQFPEKYRDKIAQKAGVLSRRHVVDECTSDVGAKAVTRLIQKSGVRPDEVGALICATSSPDRIQPATATRIQELCGLKQAFAFDVNSVCSGGIYALKLASSLVNDGIENVIVVAAEVYSRILNRNQLTTFPYFGDGAGAALITTAGLWELKDFYLRSDGSGADVIQVPAGGTMLPADKIENIKDCYFTMVGREVYDFACERGSEAVNILVERNNLDPDFIISHQANINILKEISKRTKQPFEKFHVNLDKYANTAGASVMIALSECIDEHPEAGDIVMVAFGGGLSWGSLYLKRVK